MLFFRHRTVPQSTVGRPFRQRAFIVSLLFLLLASSFGYVDGARSLLTPTNALAAGECAGFADVSSSDPACQAIVALAGRGVVKGYNTDPPTFGPADPVVRSQVAAFVVRALSWQGKPTTPRTFNDLHLVAGELATASRILANTCDSSGQCVAVGYADGDFGPLDQVTYAQVISFIARAFRLDATYAWQQQTVGTIPYSGVPGAHQRDILTYHRSAGTIPAAPTSEAMWNSPAPRAWIVRSLAQALNSRSQPSGSPSAAPTAQPSAMPSGGPGVCGEDMMHWHAAVIGGCATGHEHGDAPPAWVNSSRWMPMFDHPGNTPNENVLKHTSFKGFAMRIDSLDIYLIMHLDTNPSGHSSRFHSYQVWARDATGAVSHWDLWADFGSGNETGPHLQPPDNCGNDRTRPIMMVFPLTGCPLINGTIPYENWYSRAGAPAWGWDFGFNIQPQYYNGPAKGIATNGDIANIANWLPTGQLNADRRVELSWYGNRSNQRGEFWSDQWGTIMSGPNDPRCGTTRTFGTKSYATLCIAQYIAPSMPTIEFPDNDYRRIYNLPGVKLPN